MDEKCWGRTASPIGTTLKNMINGETSIFSKRRCSNFCWPLFFFEQLEKNGANFFILLLIAGSCCFQILQRYLKTARLEDKFYMSISLLFTILMNSYQQLGVSLGKQLEWMTQFMKGLAPAYFVAVSATSGLSRLLFYQRFFFWCQCWWNGFFSLSPVLQGLICIILLLW